MKTTLRTSLALAALPVALVVLAAGPSCSLVLGDFRFATGGGSGTTPTSSGTGGMASSSSGTMSSSSGTGGMTSSSSGTGGSTGSCNDGIQDGAETDVDCGGGTCPKCAFDKKCMTASDCGGGICNGGKCAATCTDGVQDGMETDVDCGGPVCPKCAVGKSCLAPGDCATVANGTVACTANKCALTCSTGWGDCDNMNDCATNLLTTAANCGSCGKACVAYCANGSCNDPAAVSAGLNHTCGLLADGSVWCWGSDASGELGDGLTTSSPVPKKITSLPKAATAVTAGASNSCAILSDKTLWCWGDNSVGQLGVGNTMSQPGPVQVQGLSNAIQVAVGGQHVCAVVSSGALYCWGSGLGVGNNNIDTSTPFQALTSVSKVVTGAHHTCARTTGGTLSCWGSNAQGQLGTGNTTDAYTPGTAASGLSGVVEIAAYSFAVSTCARTSADIYCWGGNTKGNLGNGNTNSPVLMPPSTPISLPNVIQIAEGDNVGGAVTSSSLYLWGTNSFGTLGDGTTTDHFAPEAIPLANVSALSVGQVHACALTTANKLYCWGWDGYGQIGNNVMTGNFTSPVAVVWP